jgi:hypothetical protein
MFRKKAVLVVDTSPSSGGHVETGPNVSEGELKIVPCTLIVNDDYEMDVGAHDAHRSCQGRDLWTLRERRSESTVTTDDDACIDHCSRWHLARGRYRVDWCGQGHEHWTVSGNGYRGEHWGLGVSR